MATVSYKCPNCGGGLVYEPESGQYQCEYCLSEFTQQKLEEMTPQMDSSQSGETAAAMLYHCPSCGAEIVFSGNAVSTLQIRFRQYVRSGETSLLLPLRQALAIASSHSGAELSIGYADRGGSTISAAWLADTDTSAAGKP